MPSDDRLPFERFPQTRLRVVPRQQTLAPFMTRPHRYTFGCAADLYARNIHPRVMLGPDDVVRLREQVKTGDGKKIMNGLRRLTRPLIEAVLEADDLVTLMKGDGTWTSPGARVSGGIDNMAIVAAVDEDDDAIEALRRLFALVHTHPGGGSTQLSACGMPMAYDMMHPYLSDAERLAYVRAARKDARRLLGLLDGRYHAKAGGNVTMNFALRPLITHLAVQGDPGAERAIVDVELLLEYLAASVNVAINPDGYPEEDIGYGSDVAAWLVFMVEATRRAGLVDLFRTSPRLLKFAQAMLHFVQPWGTYLNNLGDYGGGTFGRRDFALPRLATETNDPTLLWLLGTITFDSKRVLKTAPPDEPPREVVLRKGFQVPAHWRTLLVGDEIQGAVHPRRTKPPTAYCDRRRGIVAFRSGWDAEATYVTFDGSHRSPGAQGHAHASGGNFTISAQGEYFGIDCGRYNNEQDCHNVVLVDGKSGRTTDGEWRAVSHPARLTGYEPGGFVDYASADTSAQHNVYWARRYLGLIKGPRAPAYVWLVDDINKADVEAEFWWQLHTSPENTIKTYRSHATVTGWRHGNKLDVHFALPDGHRITEIAHDEATPSSHKYIANPHERAAEYVRPSDMLRYSAFVRPRLVAKIAGRNGRFMSLMIPRAKGAKPPAVRQLKSLPASYAVRVTFADVEDIVIFAHEHEILRAADVEARGHWCVVRRNRATGRVVDYAIREGYRLQVAGRALRIR